MICTTVAYNNVNYITYVVIMTAGYSAHRKSINSFMHTLYTPNIIVYFKYINEKCSLTICLVELLLF